MCLIVVKPKGKKNALTKEKFVRAATRNPHGIGIVYNDGNGLKEQKFVDVKDKLDDIYKIIENADSYLIHFRYATHGNKDLGNVHPFKVTDNLYVAHNGVLSKYPELNKEWSDTKNFVEGVIKPYVKEHGEDSIKNPDFIKWLEEEIGSGNKMVFVDKDMNFTIANEGAGSWIDDCWFSNTYSVEEPKKWDTYNYTSSYPTWNNYNYGSYSDYDDYGYYDNYMDYDRGEFTKEEIINFVADNIEDGFTSSYEDIPYELDIDKSYYNANPTKYAQYKKDLKDIANQVRTGATSGKTPIPWELFIDDSAMEYLTTKEDDEDIDLVDIHGKDDKQLELPLDNKSKPVKLSDSEKQLIYWIEHYDYISKSELTEKELPILKSLINKGLVKEKNVINYNGDDIGYVLTDKYYSM